MKVQKELELDDQQLRVHMNLLLTARVGDGCLFKQKDWTNYAARFMSTSYDLLLWKATILNRVDNVYVKKQSPKAYGKKDIYTVQTRCSEEISRVKELSFSSIIKELDKEDLIVWYLDDGSFHKTYKSMHLYSNCLNEEESKMLMQKFVELYGITPALRVDKKKDGRSFFYLYLGVELTKKFGYDVRCFIEANNIPSMLYKVGVVQSSTTS